jgi:hypothetical protein
MRARWLGIMRIVSGDGEVGERPGCSPGTPDTRAQRVSFLIPVGGETGEARSPVTGRSPVGAGNSPSTSFNDITILIGPICPTAPFLTCLFDRVGLGTLQKSTRPDRINAVRAGEKPLPSVPSEGKAHACGCVGAPIKSMC